MKAVVAAFNQEKALVGAFSVIVQLHRLIVYSTTYKPYIRSAVTRLTDTALVTVRRNQPIDTETETNIFGGDPILVHIEAQSQSK